MKEQILQLDRHDDVNSARDKIGWTQASRVLLVWPGRGRVLARRLDLVLVKRHAESVGAQLAIVCDDSDVVDHARELGVPVFDTLADARRAHWTRRPPAGFPLPPKSSRPKALERPAPRPLPFRIPFPETLRRAGPVARYVWMAASALAVLGLGAFLFPRATIHLSPMPRDISVSLPLTANTSATEVDPAGVLPARTISATLEASERIATTGTKDVPSTPASGFVVFTNVIGQATTIPKGTGVRTTSGTTVRFTTVENVVIPTGRGQTVRVGITAAEPGPQGNVPAGLINAIDGPLGLQLAVVNDAPTTGGGVEQKAAVTEEDRTRLREQLLAQLTQQAVAKLTAQLGEHERMPVESVKITRIDAETYDRFPTEQAETLALTLRVRASGTTVNGEQAEQLAVEALHAAVEEGYTVIPGSESIAWAREPAVDEQGHLTFELAASAEAAAAIEPEAVRQVVGGESVRDAGRLLADRFPMVSPPVIEVHPSWFPRMPWLAFRIDVIVEPGAGGD